MKNLLGFCAVFLVCLGLWRAATAIEGKQALEQEEKRLANLDVAALDFLYLVNKTDEIGGDLQLNWKEVTAITAAKLENRLRPLDFSIFEKVAADFLGAHKPRKFEAVAKLHLKKEEVQLAFSYLEALDCTGYVSDRLYPGAPEQLYIEGLLELAKENYYETGILPSILIAQTILENGWEPVAAPEAIAAFLPSPPSLEPLGSTYRQQAKNLEDAGYIQMMDESGAPVYAKRLGELIRQYNLQLIDYEILYP